MSKTIAYIGSSGGNLYKQGGNDIVKMMKEITAQTQAADMELGFVQYVMASGSLDNVGPESPASLFIWNGSQVQCVFEGTLQEVNVEAEKYDQELAEKIKAGEIDGIMFVSADPNGANAKAIEAAAEAGTPMAGTGGTGVAMIQAKGCNVLSASGTTGTTNRTRAVAFTTALAKEWGIKYRPVIGNTGAVAANKMDNNVWERINFRGIMMTSLPAFIAMALLLACSKIPGCDGLSAVFETLVGYIPVVICAIAAKQVSGMDEVGVVAGIVAGILSKDGGIIGGIVIGIFAGILVYYISMYCYRKNVPGTTVNIVAGGIGGLIAGLVGMYAIAPITLWLGNGICSVINACISYNAILAGAVAGLLIWPAIIGGVYHAAILPIVLLEIEASGYSFLGAIDMTGLVMVSAGITLANIIMPRVKGERAAAVSGFVINVGFGTFVEAAYPYMFSSRLVFAGALISGALSGALVGAFNVMGTAYVPSIVAPFMAQEGKGIYFLIAMLVAMVCACAITLVANKKYRMDEAAAEASE
ncbi:MAG: PTS sugar transporter [Clostridiales bacterium]|nr:PTS sugar transporter [Candidatus Crickella merdequi]